jgi:hypothetical protein
LGLFLPQGFGDGTPGQDYDIYGNNLDNGDSFLSSWYRGQRYGFAQ